MQPSRVIPAQKTHTRRTSMLSRSGADGALLGSLKAVCSANVDVPRWPALAKLPCESHCLMSSTSSGVMPGN